ncbi:hypothetical protein OIB37_17025 [Streptomyces sp. NBC_00820]|uniref:hypothetical protein n=1 Tax=Streptomyces sp. NBC_00820 TaxID=2975842 RepID=UPI002ED48AB4|nr:hypothetical protein OIB37_17025 [Streptomyces sp. NBC_00820]
MKRSLALAALLAALLGGTASVLSAAGQDGRVGRTSTAAGEDGQVSVYGDTAWGGSCDLPLCKPLS